MDRDANHENSDIVVQAWTPRYSAAFEKLVGLEGGLSDDPADRGGTTKYGISLRFLKAEGGFDDDGDGFADFDLDFDGDIDGQDIRKLDLKGARFLYLKCFWRELDCESFPMPVGEMLFDQGVNGGNTAARKLLQRALNMCLARTGYAMIDVDGAIGDKTRRALDKVLANARLGMPALIEAFRKAVRDRYRLIVRRHPDQRRFLQGWLNRANELGQ